MPIADPLSEALAILKPRTYVSAGLDAAGEWCLRFPAPEGIKFNAITRGACWLQVDGEAQPYRIQEGDCFLLTKSRPFVLASDLALRSMPCDEIYSVAHDGIATCNGGGAFFLVGGRFVFAADADFLFGNLPAVVHVRDSSDQASVLRWGLERLATEIRMRQPGGQLFAEHLAHIMLIQVLRVHLQSSHAEKAGWLSAIADPQIRQVVAAMHSDLARRWTIDDLAKVAAMSRSKFAQRFRDLVGRSPGDYLTRWRMLIAAERLSSSRDNIAEMANALGYDSEAAFSTAFKRLMSVSPKHYRNRLNGS